MCTFFKLFFIPTPPSSPYGSQFWQSWWARTVKINIYRQPFFSFAAARSHLFFFLTMWQTHISPIRCGSFFFLRVSRNHSLIFLKKKKKTPALSRMWLWLLEICEMYNKQFYSPSFLKIISFIFFAGLLWHEPRPDLSGKNIFLTRHSISHPKFEWCFFLLNRCPTCSASTARRGWAPSCARPSWRTLAGSGPSDATWQRTTSWPRRSCKRWGLF